MGLEVLCDPLCQTILPFSISSRRTKSYSPISREGYLTRDRLRWKSGGSMEGKKSVLWTDIHRCLNLPSTSLNPGMSPHPYRHSLYPSPHCMLPSVAMAVMPSWERSPKELASSLRFQSSCLKRPEGFLTLGTWNALSKPGARIKTIWFALQ